MDAPINRYPSGLLGFLDIKAMGKNPNALSQLVAPIYDVVPHYLAANRRVLTSGPGGYTLINADFPGSSANLQVPVGKAWIVESMWADMIGSMAADQTITARMCIARQLSGASTIQTAWVSGQVSIIANPAVVTFSGGIICSHSFQTPFVLNAGDRPAIMVNTFCGGGALGGALYCCATEVDA